MALALTWAEHKDLDSALEEAVRTMAERTARLQVHQRQDKTAASASPLPAAGLEFADT